MGFSIICKFASDKKFKVINLH